MSDIAIKVDNLSKEYHIGIYKFSKLRDRLAALMRKPLRFGRTIHHGPKDILFALKDLSFEIKRGEVVGIIGRNGAGKSTLLKILSRITCPSKGVAEVYGRIGALLEVGTGFHEELTGRDNIYLNGAMLGMKKSEIDNRFHKIVEFSGIEKFLDTPVKHYSSGMYVRLGFSVAAYLQPEVLLIDEILAVGDLEFQKKCFGKMSEIASQGKTVLIVSHNMTAINTLCNKAILLEKGKIIAIGEKDDVVNEYIGITHKLTNTEWKLRTDRQGDGSMRFVGYWLEGYDGRRTNAFRSGEESVICIQYDSSNGEKLHGVSVAIPLTDSRGNQLTDLASRISAEVWDEVPPSGVIRCKIRKLPLAPGVYYFGVFGLCKGIIADWIRDAGRFEVEVGDFYGTGQMIHSNLGSILIEHSWILPGS